MAYQPYGTSQYHRTRPSEYNAPLRHRRQSNGYHATSRYRSQSPRASQHNAASWSSDYISEPVYSDSDDYINPQEPEPTPSPARYERPSPMSSAYSPLERGTNSKPCYYTSPSPRPSRWPARYRTPSPDSDYIAQSVRTEEDYIATPAKRMPGAFVDDDTPEYGSGYSEHEPDDSSPLQHSAPRAYDRESSPPQRRGSSNRHDGYRALVNRGRDLSSSNWDRKHEIVRNRSRSRSRSRNNSLKPHELANFQEAREFLERFRALDIQGARPIARPNTTYYGDDGHGDRDRDRDEDARSFCSHRSTSSNRHHARHSSTRQSSYETSTRHVSAGTSAMTPHRSSHHYQDDDDYSSPESTTLYPPPARQSRLDRYEAHPTSHRYNTNEPNDSDRASSSYRRHTPSSGHVSRVPSTARSYISRAPSSTARSYVSRVPSPTREYTSPSRSRSRSRSHTHYRRSSAHSSCSSDNGIAEGSDYLPSSDDEEHADGGSTSSGNSGGGRKQRKFSSRRDAHMGRYSDDDDDNGVGEGSDYVSSDDDYNDTSRRNTRRRSSAGFSGGKMYTSGREVVTNYKAGWGDMGYA